MIEPILRLENVSYAYPDGPLAVDKLSVSIQKGERVAVLGRNGAGKSTFFLLCNGILEPDQGRLYCGGKEVSRGKKDLLELHWPREELLREAGLRKPWLWQAAEALRPGEENYPMTMEQFERWRKAIV